MACLCSCVSPCNAKRDEKVPESSKEDKSATASRIAEDAAVTASESGGRPVSRGRIRFTKRTGVTGSDVASDTLSAVPVPDADVVEESAIEMVPVDSKEAVETKPPVKSIDAIRARARAGSKKDSSKTIVDASGLGSLIKSTTFVSWFDVLDSAMSQSIGSRVGLWLASLCKLGCLVCVAWLFRSRDLYDLLTFCGGLIGCLYVYVGMEMLSGYLSGKIASRLQQLQVETRCSESVMVQSHWIVSFVESTSIMWLFMLGMTALMFEWMYDWSGGDWVSSCWGLLVLAPLVQLLTLSPAAALDRSSQSNDAFDRVFRQIDDFAHSGWMKHAVGVLRRQYASAWHIEWSHVVSWTRLPLLWVVWTLMVPSEFVSRNQTAVMVYLLVLDRAMDSWIRHLTNLKFLSESLSNVSRFVFERQIRMQPLNVLRSSSLSFRFMNTKLRSFDVDYYDKQREAFDSFASRFESSHPITLVWYSFHCMRRSSLAIADVSADCKVRTLSVDRLISSPGLTVVIDKHDKYGRMLIDACQTKDGYREVSSSSSLTIPARWFIVSKSVTFPSDATFLTAVSGSSEVDAERVHRAIELSGLSKTLRHYPRGRETPLSETVLSDLDRVRLSMAQCIYQRASHVLMVDAFECSESESDAANLLKSVNHGCVHSCHTLCVTSCEWLAQCPGVSNLFHIEETSSESGTARLVVDHAKVRDGALVGLEDKICESWKAHDVVRTDLSAMDRVALDVDAKKLSSLSPSPGIWSRKLVLDSVPVSSTPKEDAAASEVVESAKVDPSVPVVGKSRIKFRARTPVRAPRAIDIAEDTVSAAVAASTDAIKKEYTSIEVALTESETRLFAEDTESVSKVVRSEVVETYSRSMSTCYQCMHMQPWLGLFHGLSFVCAALWMYGFVYSDPSLGWYFRWFELLFDWEDWVFRASLFGVSTVLVFVLMNLLICGNSRYGYKTLYEFTRVLKRTSPEVFRTHGYRWFRGIMMGRLQQDDWTRMIVRTVPFTWTFLTAVYTCVLDLRALGIWLSLGIVYLCVSHYFGEQLVVASRGERLWKDVSLTENRAFVMNGVSDGSDVDVLQRVSGFGLTRLFALAIWRFVLTCGLIGCVVLLELPLDGMSTWMLLGSWFWANEYLVDDLDLVVRMRRHANSLLSSELSGRRYSREAKRTIVPPKIRWSHVGGNWGNRRLLDDVSVTFRPDQSVNVFGSDARYFSHVMFGSLHPEGRWFLDDVDVTKLDRRSLMTLIPLHLDWQWVFGDETVYDALGWFLGTTLDRVHFDATVKCVGFDVSADTLVSSLSVTDRYKFLLLVGLIRAQVYDMKYVIVDATRCNVSVSIENLREMKVSIIWLSEDAADAPFEARYRFDGGRFTAVTA